MDKFRNRFIKQMEKDVNEGFLAPKKYIKSKYFYDERGDLLFRRITNLPEYYLTTCETEILELQGKEILENINTSQPLNVIELGAGDGTKALLLFGNIADTNRQINYYPVDISPAVLRLAEENTRHLVSVTPVAADYTEALSEKPLSGLSNKLILFLGSNIGNFSSGETTGFMRYLEKNMNTGDHALIGFDLVKDEKVIMDAYNDPTGLTSDFNLNLLHIMNRDLKADFDPDNFYHAPKYDPVAKAAKSYLVSNKKQTVFFESLFKGFSFENGETIFTEISTKYTVNDIKKLADKAGFTIVSKHYDHRKYFLDVLFRKK